jgi:hypothetical protein
MIIGCGTLALIDQDKTVSDGVNYYKVFAPSLYKFFYKRKAGVNYVAGDWIVINNWVVFFIRRKKKYRFCYFVLPGEGKRRW